MTYGLLPTTKDRATLGSDLSASWDFAGSICSLYLKLTSPGFLGVLYGNPFGIAAMTLCLGIYGFSYWLGRKIVDIEV